MHQDFPETRREHMLGLAIRTVTDVGHQVLALEAPADPVVDTLGLPPVALQADIFVRLCLQGRLVWRNFSVLLTFSFAYRSDWCLMNFLVLFLTIWGL